MIFWGIVGYLFLFIFRPYEFWPIIGTFRVERIYMLTLMALVFFDAGKRYIPHLVNRMVVAFFAVLFVSGLFAYSMGTAFTGIFEYFKLLIFYFIIIYSIRDEKQLEKFILAYLTIMLLYVGKSCWEYFLHDRYSWQQGMARLVGIDSTYGNSNAFAASMVYSLPYLWAMFKLRSHSRIIQLILLAYALLIPVAIMYTGSRSGMVAALFFGVLLVLGSSKKFTTVVVLSLSLAVVWNVMPEKQQNRFLSIFIKDIAPEAASADASAQGRIDGFLQGVKTFKKYPVLGIGPYNFRYSWEGIPYEFAHNPHNLYGQILGELGAVGVIVFGSMVFSIYRCHRSVVRRIREYIAAREASSPPPRNMVLLKLVSVASMQAILLLLFNGNFGHNLYRYNWLWIGAIGVLASHFIAKELCADENTA